MVEEIMFEGKSEKGLPLPVQTDVSSDVSSTFVGSLRYRDTARRRVWEHLMADIDPTRSNFPFAWFCFMTGFTYVQAWVQDGRRMLT